MWSHSSPKCSANGESSTTRTLRRVRKAREPLERVPNNAVPCSTKTARSPGRQGVRQALRLATETRARQMVDFVLESDRPGVYITYTDGYDLRRDWVGGDLARFKRLLTEQLTPADLYMSVAERYVELGLRLGRHVDGPVDAYYGEPAVKERIARRRGVHVRRRGRAVLRRPPAALRRTRSTPRMPAWTGTDALTGGQPGDEADRRPDVALVRHDLRGRP